MTDKIEGPLSKEIRTFDKHARNNRLDEAFDLLCSILKSIEIEKAWFGQDAGSIGPSVEAEATIFCAAVTNLLLNPEFKVNDSKLLQFIPLKRSLSLCFEASGYCGTEYFGTCFFEKDSNGNTTIQRNNMIKMFLALSINSLSDHLVELLFKQSSNLTWLICLTYLSEKLVWSEVGGAARAKILSSHISTSDVTPKFHNVRYLVPAYMGCSYDASVNKHGIKKLFNKVTREWLESEGVSDAQLTERSRARKNKPSILIIAEFYNSVHAMHRSYGRLISGLRSNFKTIIMTPTGKLDPDLHSWFDEVDRASLDQERPKGFIDRAISYKPDIVYYPSIGMRLASIICSNVRIAPIQIFSPGHPATTLSSRMDYVIAPEASVASEDCFSEIIITTNNKRYYTTRKDATSLSPAFRPDPPSFRLAIPAWSRKISPGFIQACTRIQNSLLREGKGVEFWFFPNAIGVEFQAEAKRLCSLLKARVVPRLDYNSYRRLLNECDVFLSTFPFGATNSLVDAVSLGIPVVNLIGTEPHSRADALLVSQIGQPDWLTARTVNDYESAVVKLILDNKLRREISNKILDSDPQSLFFSQEEADTSEFSELFFKVYKNHEIILESKKRIWKREDILSLS